VATPTYFASRRSRIDASRMRRTSASDRPGGGASSTTFWCLRCTEQSRRPSANTVPCRSAAICTSTWRAPKTAASANSVPSPKALAASVVALSNAARSSPGSRTSRMPRPPPPAVAFSISGKPMRAATRSTSSRPIGPPLHGLTGTSAASANSLEAILSPSLRIVSALGPRKTISLASSFSTKLGSSARNPQPGQTASTRIARSAASTRS